MLILSSNRKIPEEITAFSKPNTSKSKRKPHKYSLVKHPQQREAIERAPTFGKLMSNNFKMDTHLKTLCLYP